MTRTWFPEAHYMPYGGGYLPLYRWYIGEPFKQLPGPRAPYPTASQARNAARDYMADLMARRMRSETPEATEPVDPLGYGQWRQDKAAEEAAERDRVFGSADKPKHVRGRGAERLTEVVYGRIA